MYKYKPKIRIQPNLIKVKKNCDDFKFQNHTTPKMESISQNKNIGYTSYC